MAISQPPPSAWPFMAAMTGFGKRSILRSTALPKRMNMSTPPPENAEPRSAPAQKIRSPEPVTMTARTLSSPANPSNASFSSRTSASLIALAGGRLSVMTAKLSSRSRSRVSNAILRHSLEEDRRHRVGRVAQPVAALAQHPRGRHLVHRAEEYLGGDLDRKIRSEAAGRDPLVQHGTDQVEVRRHLVGGRAAKELVPLTQLHLHDLREIGIALEHREVQGHQSPDLRHRVDLRGDLLPDEGHPLCHLFPEQRDEDVVLGLEVQIDGAAGDAGLARDV